jgi:transketolase
MATPILTTAADPEPVAAVGQARLANAIRALAMDAVETANSGHPGMPMGMADVATVLFTRFLKFDAAAPLWPDRDRFVLSAGHGSMLLYSVLHLTGYKEMPIEELKRFRQLGSRTPGHPEYGHAAGVETTTGPLGQGLGNAVGMALAERLLAARYGDEVVDHATFVIASDGDLMEGVSHEVASLAGHMRLAKLCVLYDDNRISIDGPTELALSDDALSRFAAYGWDVAAVDGHDPEAIAAAIARARTTDQPSLIACRTTIAYGAPTKAGTADSHGSPLGAKEIQGARERLGWAHPPFEVPADVLAAWREVGRRGAAARAAWEQRIAALPAARRAEFERSQEGRLPDGWRRALAGHIKAVKEQKPKRATRQSSGEVLNVLTVAIPELIGGSADLTGSNNTRAKGQAAVRRNDFAGGYIHYGVREHGMAAAMNGIALHGGLIPYGGTFLVFADYLRPSLRLAALMGQRVVYVLTHDSIGLGEDGPTHQPVEHLASLRAIPNVRVFRPADAVETAECWELALSHASGPSVIALTRQAVPHLRVEAGPENLSARGGYVLSDAPGSRRVTLLATGSEVALALEAKALLDSEGTPTAVVSLPCFALFEAQPEAYRAAVLGPAGGVRVAVEAAVGFGWDRYLGSNGAFVGMAGFGASAPFTDLYRKFGITASAVADAARGLLAR